METCDECDVGQLEPTSKTRIAEHQTHAHGSPDARPQLEQQFVCSNCRHKEWLFVDQPKKVPGEDAKGAGGDLKYRVGEYVDLVGECGHRNLKVRDINFAGSTGKDGALAHTEANAFYYLHCEAPGCGRDYQWRMGYEKPRPFDRSA